MPLRSASASTRCRSLRPQEQNLADARAQQRQPIGRRQFGGGGHGRGVGGQGVAAFAQRGDDLQRAGAGHPAIEQQQIKALHLGTL
jgi:hypothetical protein